MTLKENQFKYLIVLNLVAVIVIYLDLLLPSNNLKSESFSSIYTSKTQVAGYRNRGGVDIVNYIECKSGNYFEIGIIPPQIEKLHDNDKIKIVETSFFGKIKSLEIGNEMIHVSFLLHTVVIICMIISILITLSNIFITDRFLEFLLAFASIFIYFTISVYLFYL